MHYQMTVREKNKTSKGMLNYYMWKNIRKQYKNNKLEKIITPTQNDEFKLPDRSYSVSDNPDYVEFIRRNTKH